MSSSRGPYAAAGPYEGGAEVRLERVPGGLRLARWQAGQIDRSAPELSAADVRVGRDTGLPALTGELSGDWRGNRLALTGLVEGFGRADAKLTADLPLRLSVSPLTLDLPQDEPFAATLSWAGEVRPLWDLVAFEDQLFLRVRELAPGFFGRDFFALAKIQQPAGPARAVDPGLDRAIAKRFAGIGNHQIEVEVDRYIADPGQALAYMVVRLEIQRMRTEAQRRLGHRIDIRSFHDTVLGSRSLPLPVLAGLVNRWVGTQEK